MQNGGGRPGPFYHVNDVNVDGEGEESPIERTSWRLFLVVYVCPSGENSSLVLNEVAQELKLRTPVCFPCFQWPSAD